MQWIERSISDSVLKAASTRPAVLLTGIRQAGKSALLQKLFPQASYIPFDTIRYADAAVSDPERFLSSLGTGMVILDEIQYVPSLFRELKIAIDSNRSQYGKWILTGSQKFSLLAAAKESLAGRITILELKTLGASEIRNGLPGRDCEPLLWTGGFPELWANPHIDPGLWLDSYIGTWLEKDLRDILQTPNLRDFYRLLRACAARAGALVNFSDLARDVGISPNTAKSWVSTLVQSGIITLLEPWFANITKRLTKTPKLFFNDQGILCRLLNQTDDPRGNPFSGAIWENFVFDELIRLEGISAGRNLFFYRDQNGTEVDFLIEQPGRILLVEAKNTERPDPSKINITNVSNALGKRKTAGYVACRIPEKGLFASKGYSSFNPMLCALEL